MTRFLKTLSGGTLHFLFPPTCINCKKPLSTDKSLCSICWKNLSFLSQPNCGTCARPLDISLTPNPICVFCLRDPPLYSKTRSALIYNAHARKMISSFKQGHTNHVVPTFSQWMYHVSKDVLKDADFIIPVPLHWRRLIYRGFNQSALLAQGISKLSHVPYHPLLLQKNKSTLPQASLPEKSRHQNVKKAFSISTKYSNLINNKYIVLVDDVMATGATLSACAEPLLKAGAAKVSIIVLARAENVQEE